MTLDAIEIPKVQEFPASDFAFDWLDAETLSELEEAGKTRKGCPDFFFGTKGKCFYLRYKILLVDKSY